MPNCETVIKASWSFTDIGALIGTLSGLGSLVWNYLQWRKDKPSLLVKAGIRKMVGGGMPIQDVLAITLVNDGKRPVNIMMIAGKNQSTEFVIKPGKLPRLLKEAEAHTEAYPLDGLHEMLAPKLISLYACDMNEKNWLVSEEDVKAINDAFEKNFSNKAQVAGTNPGTKT